MKTSHKTRRPGFWILWLLSGIVRTVFYAAILAGALYLTSNHWLPLVYKALDVTQAPVAADVFVILGGGYSRAQRAADLYPQLHPQLIIVSGGHPLVDVDIQILQENGVPDSVIFPLAISNSTYEEAVNVLDFLSKSGYESALIITEPHHSRRALATFTCVNRWNNYGLELHITGSTPAPELQADNWWEFYWIANAIPMEYIKMGGYLFQYGIYCY